MRWCLEEVMPPSLRVKSGNWNGPGCGTGVSRATDLFQVAQRGSRKITLAAATTHDKGNMFHKDHLLAFTLRSIYTSNTGTIGTT
jgi:hypothetical protein